MTTKRPAKNQTLPSTPTAVRKTLTTILRVRLPVELREQVEALAKETGEGLSTVFRDALGFYFAHLRDGAGKMQALSKLISLHAVAGYTGDSAMGHDLEEIYELIAGHPISGTRMTEASSRATAPTPTTRKAKK